MLALELVDENDPASEVLPSFSDHRPNEDSDVLARNRRGRRNLDTWTKRNLGFRAFEVAIQNEDSLIAVVCDVSRKSCLHHRLRAAIPCIAPNTELGKNVDVELGLALQPVTDALSQRVQDQRERLEQSFKDSLDRTSRRRVH